MYKTCLKKSEIFFFKKHTLPVNQNTFTLQGSIRLVYDPITNYLPRDRRKLADRETKCHLHSIEARK